MSIKHSIKIDDETYKKLDEFRGKRETFSQAIDRLLAILVGLGQLRSIIEGQQNYAQWKKEQLEKASANEPRGDS